jgi:hypothetical protein
MAKRQKKSVPKPTSRNAELAAALIGRAAEPGISDLLRDVKHPLDTIEGRRREVHKLHHAISMRHSWETAERIFKSVPTAAAFRKRFREEYLWSNYELVQLQNPGWGRGRAARLLHKEFPGEHGKNPEAIVKHLKRLSRERKKGS